MKKAIILLLALSLLLTGCSFGPSQAELDALREELEEEQEKVEILEERLDALEQDRLSEHEETQAPTEPPTEAPTEAPRYLPNGTVLIDETWGNGGVVVIALDETTLWVQLVDDSPTREYEDLGTPWELRLEYGGPIHSEYNGNQMNHSPYVILVSSPAFSELGMTEYEQGNLAAHYEEESFKTLWLAKTVMFEDGSYMFEPSVYVDLEIEQEEDTYTAIISLPDWFEASAAGDLEKVDVYLHKPDFWREMAQEGSVNIETFFTFEP